MKPGLYVATVRGTKGVLLREPSPDGWYASIIDLVPVHPDAVANLRPLVVLDPESVADQDRFMEAAGRFAYETARIDDVLRALAAPTPAEPMGLGAVVRDAAGETFVRSDNCTTNPWRDGFGIPHEWPQINSPEVLSEGWTP